jgi:glycosyltransferase involved in cell wall biosynthesis
MSTDLALSPTPLPAEMRARVAASLERPVEFLDLATLRRAGIASAVRELRSKPRDAVVAVATETDRRFLGDTVLLAALVTPADRHLQWVDGVPRGTGRLAIPGLAARMALGTGLGGLALLQNRAIADRVVRDRGPRRTADGVERCLYLKPTLQFGLQVGGSVAHVAGVANAMAAEGLDVEMLANDAQPMVAPEVRQHAVRPSFLPGYPFELNSHRYHQVFFAAAEARARAWRPQVIYQRYVLNDLTGPRLRRELGIPLVLEFNGSEVWVQRHWGSPLRFEDASSRIERANLHAADVVVVVSDAVRDQAIERGAAPEKVLVYPNCVDTDVFDPARFDAEACRRRREALGVPADALLFTFVGTFGKWHGADVLAQAIRDLADARAPWLAERRAHFLFVGDGLTAPAVRSMLAGEATRGLVTLAGLQPQADTPATLAASDVLLSPHVPNADGSPFFGSPTKLFEYLAMARPIVASDLDQIGQVMRGWRPGEAPRPRDASSPFGLMVEPGDVRDLISALERTAALAPAEREAMGAAARELASGAFSWRANVRAVLAAARGA